MAYATIDEFKQTVGVDDTVDDANIQRGLDAAAQAIENYTGRVFTDFATTTSSQRIFDADWYAGTFGGWAGPPGPPFSWFFGMGWQRSGLDRLKVPDVGSVSAVELDLGLNGTFTTTIPPTQYQLYPLAVGQPGFTGNYTEIRLRPTSSYAFWPGYQVRVTGLWGWPSNDAPPDPVRMANILLANRYFRRGSAPFGLWEGPQMGQLAILPTLDPDVVQLLSPYQARGVSPQWVAA